ncbi:MAG: adenine deaminase [Thermomicrobiales bacterium]
MSHIRTRDMTQRGRLVAVAAGRAPADVILANARIVNVFAGDIEEGNVAICDGRIAGVGPYTRGVETIDLGGRYLAPGLMDAHIHLESSLLWVNEFARAVIPHGTSVTVSDPHEIANVLGLTGMRALIAGTRDLPLSCYFTMPSCVPASPRETSGATFGPEEIAEGLAIPEVIGLGELMAYPLAIGGVPEILARVMAAEEAHRAIDGHAPGVRGSDVQAYIAAGPRSDHESVTLDEAAEKLRRGMAIMIREGSTEHNLAALLPLVNDRTWPFIMFCSDDRECSTLVSDGHMDETLRLAVRGGLDPVRALQLCTINTARYWHLRDRGAIAPGMRADLVVLEDLAAFRVLQTYHAGRCVAADGVPLFESEPAIPDVLRRTMHIGEFGIARLGLRSDGDPMDAVGIIPGQIVTEHLHVAPLVADGYVRADPGRDILKLVCIERHRATGNVGVGLVVGLGLRAGAIASSVAHDAHNIIVAGTNDDDMARAVREIEAMDGGLALVVNGAVRGRLPLPIAGLLSDQPAASVADELERLSRQVQALGSPLPAPFATLSFLALSVIPAARVTDQGFVAL